MLPNKRITLPIKTSQSVVKFLRLEGIKLNGGDINFSEPVHAPSFVITSWRVERSTVRWLTTLLRNA